MECMEWTDTVEHCNVDDPTDEALINILLDNDCLAEILSYLTPMQILETPLVCKKWQTASLLAWKNIKAFYWQRCLYEEQCLILILSKCGNYLKYMTLVGVNNAPPAWYDGAYDGDHYDILRIIGQYCPNLTYWAIFYERCAESSDLIDSLLKMKKLKFIKLHKGFPWMNKKSLEIYESMLAVIPKDIEEIHCSLDEFIVPSESIVASLAEFTALRCLSLERWKLDGSVIKMMTQKYQPLTYLSFLGCDFENYDLLSKFVDRMSHTCKALKLSLLSYKVYNNFEFLTKFEMLESLEVTDPNDDVIISISNYCENIKNLKIVSQLRTNTGNALKNLEKLKNLESLHLELPSIDDDSFLGNISEHCKKIKQLVILSPTCHQLSWSKIFLKEISKMKNLKDLSIGSSNNIDDIVEVIVKKCKKLESFSITPKNIITNTCSNSLIQIANLKKFNTQWFPHITDKIILHLNMYKLTEFLCSYCGRLTDDSIMKVIENCPNLEKLEIDGNDMTEDVIIYAAKKTRKRTNHTILSMRVDEHIFLEYQESNFYINDRNKSIHKSPYLNLLPVDP